MPLVRRYFNSCQHSKITETHKKAVKYLLKCNKNCVHRHCIWFNKTHKIFVLEFFSVCMASQRHWFIQPFTFASVTDCHNTAVGHKLFFCTSLLIYCCTYKHVKFSLFVFATWHFFNKYKM